RPHCSDKIHEAAGSLHGIHDATGYTENAPPYSRPM
ncbi:hypothetical protein A2U01_0082689, partial [Trifolium medium]|nr:hypothetical protein [Trifolium medium]